MSVVKKKKNLQELEHDATRFERYDKAPYFVKKNKQAAELINRRRFPIGCGNRFAVTPTATANPAPRAH